MEPMATDHPENQWITDFKKGDVEALAKLVEHFRRPLFAYILNMMQGRGDPEEIFQEVWLRAIRNLPRYRDRNFIGWLFRISKNLFIDQIRKENREVPATSLSDPEEGEDPVARHPDRSASPDEQVAHRDTGCQIQQALSALPAEQREVFLMRTEADLSFKEIAVLQGTTLNTALSRMHYALQKLRPLLDHEYRALGRR